MRRIFRLLTVALTMISLNANAQQIDKIKYGDFNSWITRTLKESSLIGGNEKTIYEVGPTQTIVGNKPYVPNGSPWGTSNVYAKVKGIVKGSNAVFPAVRSGSDKCAKLSSIIEHVKVLGIVDMQVMVAGSMFLGRMFEPVTSTSNPYANMDMGVAYTKRPKALVFDYKVEMPSTNVRTKATGFGSKKTLQGHDNAVVFVYLQSRWEDEKGNLHAKRVASAGKKFTASSPWVNGYKLPLMYGNISGKAGYEWLGLRTGKNCYYALNSKGKRCPVVEEGWDANATPTHVVVMLSAGDGEPFVGTEGLNFYVDNVGFQL